MTTPGHDPDFRHIEVLPLTGALGAEVLGIDLREPLSDEVSRELREAFYRYSVLSIPDQPLTPEQHMAFSPLFGPMMDLPHIPRVPGYELYHQVRREATEDTRLPGENWHSDSTFLPEPPAAIVMRAVDVPPFGGDTMFTSSYLAYETLSDGLKATLETLDAVHSATRVFGQESTKHERRFAHREGVSTEEGDKETRHPVVCTHPYSGRKHLLVNRTYTQRFDGWSAAESQDLLNYLYQHISKVEFNCRIRWRNDTVVIWDNQATMHRAIPDFLGKFRLLHRTTHAGPRPSR